jgi:DNA-binding MarR family transcriptional regulator
MKKTQLINTSQINKAQHILRTICQHERKAILEFISLNPKCSVKKITDATGLLPSLTSTHLCRLRKANFVSFEKSGTNSLYTVNTGLLAKVNDAVERICE